MMIKRFLGLGFFLLASIVSAQQKTYEVKSPDGLNNIKFEIERDIPTYRLSHGDITILEPSQMGFVFKDGDSLFRDMEVSKVEEKSYDKDWEQVWGEQHTIRNNYNQIIVKLVEKNNKKRKLDIHFRAFNDGIAFRYEFPEQGVKDSIFLMDELTTFNLKDDGKAWWIPAYDEQRYENLFTDSAVSTLDTIHTPLTIESISGLALSFHEANLEDFASMTLARVSGNTLKADLVPWSDGVKVRTTKSFTTPWRTLQIADKPKNLITSYLILNLNEPNKIENTSWIKPYKYIGIWWGMHIGKFTFWEGENQGATTKNAKEYIDYCNKLGVDNLLIEGWNKGWTPQWYENHMHQFSFTDDADNFDLEEVTDYAREHGVEIIGYHETGSNLVNYLSQIDEAFALYQKVGIKSIKIGQVGSKLNMKEWHHGQFGVNYYRYVLKKAAEYNLTVFFHEPIKDTGERRTYPNMMSREGARGQEYNAWSDGNPPNYTAVLPFTRLLAGPMDYTAGILDVNISQGYPGRRVHGTAAQQLALLVTVFSPIQMYADLPENYVDQPAFQFLSDVPTDWEETRVLNGEIGKYITTVRKDLHSDDWFLGSITNEKPRDFDLTLDFLEEGVKYSAEIYADAKNTDYNNYPENIGITTREVAKGDILKLHLGAAGGAAVRFKRI